MKTASLSVHALRVLMALSFALLAAGNPSPPGNGPWDLTVDFVSDMKGSLEPCG